MTDHNTSPPSTQPRADPPATETLAGLNALGTVEVPDLPGAYSDTRTIAGRGAVCVYFSVSHRPRGRPGSRQPSAPLM